MNDKQKKIIAVIAIALAAYLFMRNKDTKKTSKKQSMSQSTAHNAVNAGSTPNAENQSASYIDHEMYRPVEYETENMSNVAQENVACETSTAADSRDMMAVKPYMVSGLERVGAERNDRKTYPF